MDRWVRFIGVNEPPKVRLISTNSIKDHAAAVVSDEEFEKRAERWPDSTPDTKEAYFIRQTFDGG